MNGGLVPLLLLSATVGLVLGFVPRRAAAIALGIFAIAAVLGWSVPTGLSPSQVYTALWVSAILVAILVYFPAARWSAAAPFIGFNAGLWLGASAGLASDFAALVVGSLPALAAIPARWLTARKYDIVIKVVASWMIAIASLSLFVSLLSTPGYKPDHME